MSYVVKGCPFLTSKESLSLPTFDSKRIQIKWIQIEDWVLINHLSTQTTEKFPWTLHPLLVPFRLACLLRERIFRPMFGKWKNKRSSVPIMLLKGLLSRPPMTPCAVLSGRVYASMYLPLRQCCLTHLLLPSSLLLDISTPIFWANPPFPTSWVHDPGSGPGFSSLANLALWGSHL